MRKLKHLAELRRKSKGQLVREAISACYQTSLSDLPLHQSQAIAAYQGGFHQHRENSRKRWAYTLSSSEAGSKSVESSSETDVSAMRM